MKHSVKFDKQHMFFMEYCFEFPLAKTIEEKLYKTNRDLFPQKILDQKTRESKYLEKLNHKMYCIL